MKIVTLLNSCADQKPASERERRSSAQRISARDFDGSGENQNAGEPLMRVVNRVEDATRILANGARKTEGAPNPVFMVAVVSTCTLNADPFLTYQCFRGSEHGLSSLGLSVCPYQKLTVTSTSQSTDGETDHAVTGMLAVVPPCTNTQSSVLTL